MMVTGRDVVGSNGTSHWLTVRQTLTLDAGLIGLTAILTLLAMPWVSAWVGIGVSVLRTVVIILTVGVVLLGFTAAPATTNPGLLWLVTLLNAGWVGLSLWWLASRWVELTPAGRGLVTLQAIVVLLFVKRYVVALRNP